MSRPTSPTDSKLTALPIPKMTSVPTFESDLLRKNCAPGFHIWDNESIGQTKLTRLKQRDIEGTIMATAIRIDTAEPAQLTQNSM
ncbi:hypothetical protein EBB79_06810 [Parasedimentitalea marina]|uniref:Uncharacterized protein n=1 Tax=Parasedimentitalea marina TaxID=2483033 RepID=A0A3T0N0S3_9RHOB|nr:hypothetical protein EBB79_06810 [Parasedimentitalea marina]